MIGSWLEMFRALGQALVEVFKAELAEVSEELGISAKHLGWALAFFGAVACIFFWFLMALYVFLLTGIWALFETWGSDYPGVWATGLGALLFLIAMGVFGFLGYRRIRKVENPAETVRRRYEEHREWWDEHLLPQEDTAREELENRSREELS